MTAQLPIHADCKTGRPFSLTIKLANDRVTSQATVPVNHSPNLSPSLPFLCNCQLARSATSTAHQASVSCSLPDNSIKRRRQRRRERQCACKPGLHLTTKCHSSRQFFAALPPPLSPCLISSQFDFISWLFCMPFARFDCLRLGLGLRLGLVKKALNA